MLGSASIVPAIKLMPLSKLGRYRLLPLGRVEWRAFRIRPYEQRNAYQGVPARPVVHVGLRTRDGGTRILELLADTGNPCAIVVSKIAMAELSLLSSPDVNSNFGVLEGGWLRVYMPELNLDREIIGYASDAVANATKKSDPAFQGLAELPFLA